MHKNSNKKSKLTNKEEKRMTKKRLTIDEAYRYLAMYEDFKGLCEFYMVDCITMDEFMKYVTKDDSEFPMEEIIAMYDEAFRKYPELRYEDNPSFIRCAETGEIMDLKTFREREAKKI